MPGSGCGLVADKRTRLYRAVLLLTPQMGFYGSVGQSIELQDIWQPRHYQGLTDWV